MDDCDASILAKLIRQGNLPNLKGLDVSGNHITTTGEGYFAKTMQDKNVQDMILLTKKLDLNAKFIFGNKEEKIAIYKELLQQGKDKGVNNDVIVVDTSFLGMVKNAVNQGFVVAQGGWGFAKCQWNPEELLQAYAENRLIATLPKGLGKLAGNTINAHSIVSCYLGATEEAWTSNSGQQVIKHELCVMGELEFCNDY
jgi:Leucine-rich repeat (LRR) protein